MMDCRTTGPRIVRLGVTFTPRDEDTMADTVTIRMFHNTATDSEGRSLGMAIGFQPGHRLEPVFQYRVPIDGGFDVHRLADDAFEVGNADEEFAHRPTVVRAYRSRQVRSLSVGDVVIVNDKAVAVDSFGFSDLDWSADTIKVMTSIADRHEQRTAQTGDVNGVRLRGGQR